LSVFCNREGLKCAIKLLAVTIAKSVIRFVISVAVGIKRNGINWISFEKPVLRIMMRLSVIKDRS
jgi:F0F1-type ATP synthase membrane subunit a